MVNSVIEALYVTLKTKYEPSIFVRYPYSYDEASIPYAYLYQVDDTLGEDCLCDDTGGVSRFTFGYMSKTFEDCVDTLESMIAYVKTLVGVYTGLTISQIEVENARDLSDVNNAQEKVFRREFDIITTWSK